MKFKKTETKQRCTYTYYGTSEEVAIIDNNVRRSGYPEQKVIKENGILIVHYYPNDHGNPTHLHVIGGGQSTKIGPLGKPVKGQPKLSPKQARVINANLRSIKKAIKLIQKELRRSRNKSFAIT